MKQTFLQMDAEAEKRALTAYGHELTILARMHFTDGEVERACQCNELLHVVMGYLLKRSHDAQSREHFAGMLAAVAKQRGWTSILRRSLADAVPR